MILRRACIFCVLWPWLWAASAWAEGQQFTNTCSTISWNANQEPDLAGYKLYDRVSTSNPYTLIGTVGVQITSVPCSQFNFNAGQHYVSITAFNTSGGESTPTADVPFYIVFNQINDLRITAINATDMTLAWTEVDGGDGLPATYDVRFATPTISWGSATSVTSGTCEFPVAGTSIGGTRTCTVTGLATTTQYQFELVPYRGTSPNVIFGPLSNVATGITGGTPPGLTRVITFSDDFERADDLLGMPPNWRGGFNGWTNLNLVGGAVRATSQYDTNSAEGLVPSTVTFTRNQFMQFTLKTWAPSGGRLYAEIALRVPGDPPTYQPRYVANAVTNGYSGETSSIELYHADGSKTVLASESATTWAAGDQLDFEAVWNDATATNDLTLRRNGSILLQTTDAEITATGQPVLILWIGHSPSTLASLEIESIQAGQYLSGGTTDVCGCDNH